MKTKLNVMMAAVLALLTNVCLGDYNYNGLYVNESSETIEEVGGVQWSYRVMGYYTISGYAPIYACIYGVVGNHERMEIPSTIGGLQVVRIGDSAFNGCTMRELIIPEGVTEIGLYAFCRCLSLESVSIPASLTKIPDSAFNECDNICEITVAPSNNCYSAANGMLLSSDGTTVKKVFSDDVILPEGTTTIDMKNTTVRSIYLPSTFRDLSPSIFSGCRFLENVNVADDNPWFCSVGGMVYDKSGMILVYCPPCNDNLCFRVPDGVKGIGASAFGVESFYSIFDDYGYGYSQEFFDNYLWLTFPSSVSVLGVNSLSQITLSTSVDFEGLPPAGFAAAGLPEGTIMRYNRQYSNEWRAVLSSVNKLQLEQRVLANGQTVTEYVSVPLSYNAWPYDVEEDSFSDSGVNTNLVAQAPSSVVQVQMTVTNVVVNYVLNSVQPEYVLPVKGALGFVNVIAEVSGSGGAVAIPASWKENYSAFEKMYGSDFTKALTMKNGKVDAMGNEGMVWQDFVAGTDPTDPDDKFTASITIVDGEPMISYTPELPPEQAVLRSYRYFGKEKLGDTEWTDITALSATQRAAYNFFKVTVEMK